MKYKNNTKKPRFNGVYSRRNLPKIKNGTYVINFDEYKSIEIHWIALYLNNNNVTYFNSFELEYIPKEIEKVNSQITNDSIICGYLRIGFIDFMVNGKNLLDHTTN